MSTADTIIACLAADGRTLRLQLPDGTSVPVSAAELASWLLDNCIASKVIELDAREQGNLQVSALGNKAPGRKPRKRDWVRAEMLAGIAAGEFTIDELDDSRLWPRLKLRKRFGNAHHETIDGVMAEIAKRPRR